MSGSDVAAFCVLVIFGGPVALIVIMRVLAHRERIEMIRRGMTPPPTMSPGARRWVRENSGMPPPPPQAPQAPFAAGPPPQLRDRETPEASLMKGIQIGLVGLAIFLGLSWGMGPGPWLLGGLIPMFIGIAQIIIAILSGAQIILPRGFSQAPPAPPPPYSGAAPQPNVYQPGPEPPVHSGFEELKRPAPPPDRR